MPARASQDAGQRSLLCRHTSRAGAKIPKHSPTTVPSVHASTCQSRRRAGRTSRVTSRAVAGVSIRQQAHAGRGTLNGLQSEEVQGLSWHRMWLACVECQHWAAGPRLHSMQEQRWHSYCLLHCLGFSHSCAWRALRSKGSGRHSHSQHQHAAASCLCRLNFLKQGADKTLKVLHLCRSAKL